MHIVFNALFFLLVGHMMIASVRKHWPERDFLWKIWGGFRPLMLLETLALLTITIAAAVSLYGLGQPFTWGWYKLLTGHGGNVGVQPILDAGRSGHVLLLVAALGLLALFLVLIPFFARSEEIDFRKGRETWKQILPTSVKFGLVHMIVGVPLAVGLALSVPGVFFAWKYKRSVARVTRSDQNLPLEFARMIGVMRSTTYHALYNSVLGILFFLALLLQAT